MTPVPPVPAATLASTLATQADRLAAYVISLGATPTEAEEVVQEVAVVAAATATEPAQPLAWLVTVARRRFIDHLRRRQTRQTRELPLDTLDAALTETFTEADPDLDQRAEAEAAALRTCLSSLAPQARLMIDLHYWQALDTQAIAEILGWRDPAVRVALSKIRRHLTACVQRALRRGKDDHGGT